MIVLVVLIVISLLIALNIPVHKLLPWARKDQEVEGEDYVTQPLKDNVIVKRGSQIVDMVATKKAEEPARQVSQSDSSVEREFVIKLSKSGKWTLPPLDLLHTDKDTPRSGDINANVSIIKRTLSHFGIEVEMGEVSIGPTVTQFTLRPAVGVKLSRITGLSSDLSLALAAHPIRIEAPIPGKALVGIEVPNKKSAIVGLRSF